MALPMLKPSRQDREEAWSRVDFREDDVDILYAFDREKAPSRWKWSASDLTFYLATLIMLPRGITVDSGAADSVFPASWLRRTLLKASPGSIAGQFYVAASGTRLANLGQILVKFLTKDGGKAEILFQVADINKP